MPDADLDAEIGRCTGLLRRGAPGALAATKTCCREAAGCRCPTGWPGMAALSAERFASPEAQEGMAAFAEKRDPGLGRPAQRLRAHRAPPVWSFWALPVVDCV